jgi:hypothetical protein
MIPEIGLMIGAYTFTRLLSFVMRRGEREEHAAVKVFAILGMIGTVFICFDLLIRSSGAPTIPPLRP